jgi:homoserine O-acetyltransferase
MKQSCQILPGSAARIKNPNAVIDGLRRHADLWSVMGYSTEMFKKELWRDLGFSSVEEFCEGFTQAYFCTNGS